MIGFIPENDLGMISFTMGSSGSLYIYLFHFSQSAGTDLC